MVKVSVLYPQSAGTTFDMTYYLNHHVCEEALCNG